LVWTIRSYAEIKARWGTEDSKEDRGKKDRGKKLPPPRERKLVRGKKKVKGKKMKKALRRSEVEKGGGG